MKNIKIADLLPNEGQIEGVPRNPRKISPEKLEKLKQSVTDYPEMLKLRPMIATPHGDKYIVLCGNMRLRALKELGVEESWVEVAEAEPEKLRAYATLDNVPFGTWDYDLLPEWDTEELKGWGVDVPEESEIDIDSFFNEHLGGEKEQKEKITIVIPPGYDKEEIKSSISVALESYKGVAIK